MKIAEETGDPEMKESAKVNFGMANASMKWNNHVTDILKSIQGNVQVHHEEENEGDEDDDKYEGILPKIQSKR